MKPVAWYDPSNGVVSTDKNSPLFTPLGQVWPLFSQREQDGECKHCTDGCPACDARKLPEQPPYHHFVSDRFNIDPQTGNLNIGAVKKQEPVAWAKFSAKGNIIDLLNEPDDDYTPLYTTPPQRPWVGLTDEEIMQCLDQGYGINMRLDGFARIIEAKLKEKNCG